MTDLLAQGVYTVSLGAVHRGSVSSGPCGSQQSCPAEQQLLPQHGWPEVQVAVHGGSMH